MIDKNRFDVKILFISKERKFLKSNKLQFDHNLQLFDRVIEKMFVHF